MLKRLAVLFHIGFLCTGLICAQSVFQEKIRITPKLGFEYLQRSLEPGAEGEDNPALQSMFFTIGAEFTLNEKLTFEAFTGYSITGLDEMVFSRLPFSIELDAGNIGGLVFGGGLSVILAELSDFEISGRGRIVVSIGMDKEWAIPGLAVEGTAEGSPNWLQITVGPVVTYTAFDNFYPYVFLGYEHFSGSFTLEEEVQTLSGSEKYDIDALGVIHAAIGTHYWLTDRLRLQGEVSLIPNSESVDWGVTLNARYEF
jgi:hypothetical protein